MNHLGSTVSVFGGLKAKYASRRSARIFRRETVRAIKAILKERRTTPRISRYLPIPPDASPWPNQGVHLDQPDILLRWGTSDDAIRKMLEQAGLGTATVPGRAYSDIPATFLSYDVRLYLNYELEYGEPHIERTLGSGALWCAVQGSNL